MALNPTKPGKIYDSVALTTSYPSPSLLSITETAGFDDMLMLVEYTNGASGTANELFYKIEYSHDRITWGQETIAEATTTAGQTLVQYREHKFVQVAADLGVDSFVVAIPYGGKNFRVSFKEVVNSGVAGGVDVTIIHSFTRL